MEVESTSRTQMIRRTIPVYLLFHVLVGAPAAAQSIRIIPPCTPPPVPREVRSLIETKFPLWRIKEPSDLKSVAQEGWRSLKPLQCPGIAVGRFDASHTLEYAFLLVPKENPYSAYRLVIVAHQLGKKTVDAHVIESSDSADVGDYLIRGVRLNEVFNTAFLRNLQVQDGIMLADWARDEYETDVFFWRDGKFVYEPVELESTDLSLTQ